MYVVSGSGSLSMNAAFQAVWRVVRDIRGMTRPSSAYRPKTPAQSVLYQVVRDHFETFRAEAGRSTNGTACRDSSRRSFEGSCAADFVLAGSRAFTAARAGSIGLSRSPDDR